MNRLSYAQIERLINSAYRQFESQLCDSIIEQLPARCRQGLDNLTGPQSDSWILDADEIPLNQLKQEAGGAGLKSLRAELSKLKTIEQLMLPTGLFKDLNEPLVEGYRLRVDTESLTEIRRHPDPIHYLLLSAFCHQRSREIVDSIIELFILLVHRLESRSRRRHLRRLLPPQKRMRIMTSCCTKLQWQRSLSQRVRFKKLSIQWPTKLS